MTIGTVRKAVAALLTSALGMLALFGLAPDFATPEMIAAASGVIAAVVGAVWAVPNDPPEPR